MGDLRIEFEILDGGFAILEVSTLSAASTINVAGGNLPTESQGERPLASAAPPFRACPERGEVRAFPRGLPARSNVAYCDCHAEILGAGVRSLPVFSTGHFVVLFLVFLGILQLACFQDVLSIRERKNPLFGLLFSISSQLWALAVRLDTKSPSRPCPRGLGRPYRSHLPAARPVVGRGLEPRDLLANLSSQFSRRRECCPAGLPETRTGSNAQLPVVAYGRPFVKENLWPFVAYLGVDRQTQAPQGIIPACKNIQLHSTAGRVIVPPRAKAQISSKQLKGETMAKYLFQATYSAEGAKGLLGEGGTKRRDAATKAIKAAGGKVEAFYFTFGKSDAIVIVDLPDNVRAAAVALAINASGVVTTSTTVLLTPAEIDEAVKKSVPYRGA